MVGDRWSMIGYTDTGRITFLIIKLLGNDISLTLLCRYRRYNFSYSIRHHLRRTCIVPHRSFRYVFCTSFSVLFLLMLTRYITLSDIPVDTVYSSLFWIMTSWCPSTIYYDPCTTRCMDQYIPISLHWFNSKFFSRCPQTMSGIIPSIVDKAGKPNRWQKADTWLSFRPTIFA